jgi:hypothetical protein
VARTYADMQLEVMERLGADDSRTASRVRRWLNDARQTLDGEELWDYLKANTTGTAPITVADLDQVESVVDVANLNVLEQIDRDTLAEDVADLTLPGLAAYWYKTAPTTIAVFPVTTATLTVRYTKFSADMAAAADEPLVADRWRQAIIERACYTGLRYKGDWTGAAACKSEYDSIVQQMRVSMVTPQERVGRAYWALDD